MADEELANYRLQLQQVEAALLGDPDNDELLKLKSDLDEIITLQEELAATSASSEPASKIKAPTKEWKVGDRVMAPLPNGNRGVAVVDSVTAAGLAITFVTSGQKTIVDPSDLTAGPDGGIKKNYVFDNKTPSSVAAGGKKEWHAERERRKLKAKKKEEKRKELDTAKETEKSSWLKFNNKASVKGMKGMKRVIASGSAQDGPAGGMKSQATVSSRSSQFSFKSARGSMDSLF